MSRILFDLLVSNYNWSFKFQQYLKAQSKNMEVFQFSFQDSLHSIILFSFPKLKMVVAFYVFGSIPLVKIARHIHTYIYIYLDAQSIVDFAFSFMPITGYLLRLKKATTNGVGQLDKHICFISSLIVICCASLDSTCLIRLKKEWQGNYYFCWPTY